MTRLEKIKAKYNIITSDFEEIKYALKEKLKESHPDNNNNYDADYFTELIGDLEYVERLIGRDGVQETLVPISEVVNTLKDMLQVPLKKEIDEKELLDMRLSESIHSQMIMVKKHWWTYRISSATVLVIITFLWSFPNQVVKHPLTQMIFDNVWHLTERYVIVITFIWLCVLLFTIAYWLVTIRSERTEKAIVDRLKLESMQNKIFMEFMHEISPKSYFSKEDFMMYLSDKFMQRTGKFCISYFQLREEVVQSMADIILFRAKEREVIRTVKSHSLLECYEIIQDE